MSQAFYIDHVHNNNENVDYDINILSFNNPQRLARMKARVNELKLNAKLYNYYRNDDRTKLFTDMRIQRNYPIYVMAIFYNFLRMIEDFYNHSTKNFGIFFENDVFFKKSIKDELIVACQKVKELKLDVLLIGYLIDHDPKTTNKKVSTDCRNNVYYDYDMDLWGAQGFMITRAHAKFLIDMYSVDYVLNKDREDILCSDSTFTKLGRKAFIYPALCVEEGITEGKKASTVKHHLKCREFQYNDNYTAPGINIDGFDYYECLDSNGNDIKQVLNKTVFELAEICNNTSNCVAFNTYGWLKYAVENKKDWGKINYTNGLYVKKNK